MTRVVGTLVSDAVAREIARTLHRAMHEAVRRDAETFSPETWAFHDEVIAVARGGPRPDADPDASPDAEDEPGMVGSGGVHVVGLRAAAKILSVAPQTLHAKCVLNRFPHTRDKRGRYVFLRENLEAPK